MSTVAVVALLAVTVVVVVLFTFLFRLAMAFKTVNSALKEVVTELGEMTDRSRPMGPAVDELNQKVEELRATLGQLSGENPK